MYWFLALQLPPASNSRTLPLRLQELAQINSTKYKNDEHKLDMAASTGKCCRSINYYNTRTHCGNWCWKSLILLLFFLNLQLLEAASKLVATPIYPADTIFRL